MKALILAGGRGSRLQEFTETKNKCMYNFRGRPLITYSLDYACGAGVSEILIVVSYLAESIINVLGNAYKGIPIKYVIQWERKGLVHAMETSQGAIGGDDFMLFLADEVLANPRHVDMVKCFQEQKVFTLCGVVPVKDTSQIKKTYAVIYNERDSRIYRLIEKPRAILNNLMGTGNCIFRNAIFDYVPYTPINQVRGEKELPDLIQCAVDDGMLVQLFGVGTRYVNVNTVDDIGQLESGWPED
ncbi:MAG: nucleotidyl transferase [Chloroflexi bacterium]|nr:MAG: nucleotidyl transferase [Chloroflexota bacterium]